MSTPQRPHRTTDQDRPPAGADRRTTASPAGEAVLLYTPTEAARLLRVRESWLRKKAAARDIPCTFLGKHLRFSPADLAAIVAASARPAVGRKVRRKSTTIVRDRDLPPGPKRSVHPPDRDDHVSDDGSTAWHG